MMPGVSELWEEVGFNALAPWRFEGLSENNGVFHSSQREMESLTLALQRELCSVNYEKEMRFAASSLRPEWKCKDESSKNKILSSEAAEKELNLGKTKSSSLSFSGGEVSETESLIGKRKNYLSVNGGGKVSKRKSRAASKTPITFLNADPANFRAMVQQVTGVPLNPAATRLWPPTGVSIGIPSLLKPEPKRPSSSSSTSSAASIIQGLPTLDTSALFIHSARQNPSSAAAAANREHEIFLTEKLRAACMQTLKNNNGGSGGRDFVNIDQESIVNIVQTEADSWLNASSLDGI